MYELLEKMCREKGITITKLCVDITGSKGNLATWKKGNINPTSLVKIADFFGVSTDFLLGRTKVTGTQAINNNGMVEISGTQANVINNSKQSLDEMSTELLKRFNSLSFDEKLDVFNYIKDKKSMVLQ